MNVNWSRAAMTDVDELVNDVANCFWDAVASAIAREVKVQRAYEKLLFEYIHLVETDYEC